MGLDAVGLAPVNEDGQGCRVGGVIKDFLADCEKNKLLESWEVYMFFGNSGANISAERTAVIAERFREWLKDYKLFNFHDAYDIVNFDKFLQWCGGFTII